MVNKYFILVLKTHAHCSEVSQLQTLISLNDIFPYLVIIRYFAMFVLKKLPFNKDITNWSKNTNPA
jgi:hypothetical protein